MTDLEIDREIVAIRQLLDEATRGSEGGIESRDELRARINDLVAALVGRYGDEVVTYGLGRALVHDAGEQDRLRKAKAAIAAQYDAEIAALQQPVSLFEVLIDDLARRHRERTGRGTMKVPGVGTWRTRIERVNPDGTPGKVARVTDAGAAIAWLDDREEREQFVEDVPRLRVNDFKAYALGVFEDAGEVLPGVDVADAEITVSHSLSFD